ncbi:MarR family transcriptional regulator [Streptomyces axinellae]
MPSQEPGPTPQPSRDPAPQPPQDRAPGRAQAPDQDRAKTPDQDRAQAPDQDRAQAPGQDRAQEPALEHARVAAEVSAAVAALSRQLRAASPAGAFTPTQRSALGRIYHWGPTTIAALARAELVRPQSMRITVGALEEQGVLTRSPHPTDGRQVVFSLTDEGRRTLEAVLRAKRGWLADAIATRLDADEQRRLSEAAALLRRLVAENNNDNNDTPPDEAATR